jgi:hypothetical protein
VSASSFNFAAISSTECVGGIVDGNNISECFFSSSLNFIVMIYRLGRWRYVFARASILNQRIKCRIGIKFYCDLKVMLIMEAGILMVQSPLSLVQKRSGPP